jgi:hypothetical protein
MQNKYKLREKLKKKIQNKTIVLLNYVTFRVTNKIKRKF